MTTEAEAKAAFLDALAAGESDPVAEREGISPYFILFGGGSFEHLPRTSTGFPIWAGVRGSWGITHAAGRPQFQPSTWEAQAHKLGLTDFSPASQDAAAWDLAETGYHKLLGRNLLQDLLADQIIHVAPVLRSTWTSLNSKTFPTRYRMALAAICPPADPPYLALVLALEAPERELVQIGLKAVGARGPDGRDVGRADADIGPRTKAALAAYREAIA